jgi:exonuclease VII large subunit
VIVERIRPRVKAPAPAIQAPAVVPPSTEDLRSGIEAAVKNLEATFASRLKKAVAASEAGMIQAAKDAIAAKQQIDQRLGERARTVAEEKKQAEAARLEALRRAEEARRKRQAKPPVAPTIVPAKPAAPALRPVLPVRPVAANQPAPVAAPPAPPPAPKILVTDAPSARATPPEADASQASDAQISGRGGWKSVRRDPARVAAQAKAKGKPTNRADAVDLAQAAQNAIARFIAERGVTRTETAGIPALVSRLQARGYIVVRDETGWTIDQRHRVESEDALIAFADARGITIDVAA